MRGADGTVVVDVRGDIDTTSSERLRRALTEASRRHPSRVVVDLTHVTFIDSTGISALVGGYNTARTLGIPYAVRRPSPFVSNQLRQTGLYDLLTAEQ